MLIKYFALDSYIKTFSSVFLSSFIEDIMRNAYRNEGWMKAKGWIRARSSALSQRILAKLVFLISVS